MYTFCVGNYKLTYSIRTHRIELKRHNNNPSFDLHQYQESLGITELKYRIKFRRSTALYIAHALHDNHYHV